MSLLFLRSDSPSYFTVSCTPQASRTLGNTSSSTRCCSFSGALSARARPPPVARTQTARPSGPSARLKRELGCLVTVVHVHIDMERRYQARRASALYARRRRRRNTRPPAASRISHAVSPRVGVPASAQPPLEPPRLTTGAPAAPVDPLTPAVPPPVPAPA